MTARIAVVIAWCTSCAISCSHGCPTEHASPSPELACQDFYQYANRDWLASVTIPPDEERWSLRLEMKRRTLEKLHEILEGLRAAAQPPGSLEAKLGVFYATCMDAERSDGDAAGPLRAELARIDAIDSHDGLVREIGRLHLQGTAALFWFASAPDPRRSTDVIAEASPAGVLGLPDRDYSRPSRKPPRVCRCLRLQPELSHGAPRRAAPSAVLSWLDATTANESATPARPIHGPP